MRRFPRPHRCLAHERRPALWFAVFKSDQAEHAAGPFRAHKANTSVPDANGNMVSTDVAAVRLDLPPSSWIFALASLSGGRTDATFAVSARYRAADGPEAVEIPFEGIPGTNMITVSGIPESPPPSRPPPPAPPPGSPLVMDGLQLWLDASRQDVQCDGVCAAGSVPGLFKDVLPAGRHFQERGNCQWNSQSVNGASIGYFDVNTCGGFQRAAWAEWLQAGDVTAEVWAKLRGYRSGNTVSCSVAKSRDAPARPRPHACVLSSASIDRIDRGRLKRAFVPLQAFLLSLF